MKKTVLLYYLLFIFCVLKGQPNITNVTFPGSVQLFQKYEISFKLGPYSNPYDPDTISVYAIFTGPNSRCDSVIGFYYEGYSFYMDSLHGYEHAVKNSSPDSEGWKIRFTPDTVGVWYFRVHAVDRNGESCFYSHKARPCTFTCLPVNNAQGFITKANTRYLKRDVVKNGIRSYNSFIPVGPNVAWYSCKDYGQWKKPYGIYDYRKYIDSLSDNCNYMRVWITRYQYLSLYGPEFTETPTMSYFASSLNQKDAAELDYIVDYASQNGIALMPCIFTYGDFNAQNIQEPTDPSKWENNPYNTILAYPQLFFSDTGAKKVTKNLIRYIVARWGYAPNIMSWELWNEVTNINLDPYSLIDKDVIQWHKEMAYYLREIDPFNHCVSTSMSKYSTFSHLYSILYHVFDFVQKHDYQNINKAASKHQFSYILYKLSNDAHTIYPNKPFFIGEFGFGNSNLYNSKDPHGIDLHNSLWSSLFSTSMGPGSFWFWHYLDVNGLYNRFSPVLEFCRNLPKLSDSFVAYTTGTESGHTLLFPNNIETYYMKNGTEDTIYGWSQDTAFAYQSLRRLTDSVIPANQTNGLHFVDSAVFDPYGYVYTLDPLKRPQPSSNSNTIKIPISNMPIGTQYEVHWFNSETGLEYNNSSPDAIVMSYLGERYILLSFPSSIRNLSTHSISNTFGDAVFAVYRKVQGGNDKTKEEH